MRVVLLATLLLLAAGCSRPIADAPDTVVAPAAPTAPARAPSAAAAPAAAPAPARAAPRVAPPMSTPLPPDVVETPTGSKAPPKIDLSCRTDTDCAVKDVGNCCGAQPACVNANSPTDPAAVKAQCAKEGRMSVCAAKPIASCSCVAGACKANVMMTD